MKKLLYVLPISAALTFQACLNEDGVSGDSNPGNDPWVKEYIDISSGERPEFPKKGKFIKTDRPEAPTQVGETEWPAEALAKGAAFTPYVQNVSVTTTTSCPAFQGRNTVDLNKGAGGKYIYLCWGQDDGIRDALLDASHGAGYTAISDIVAEDWSHYWDGKVRPSRDASEYDGYYFRESAPGNPVTMINTYAGSYRSGGVITGRYVHPFGASNGDINQGAGGEHFIYLIKYFTRGAANPYRLKSLSAVAGGSGVVCPTGYSKVNWFGTSTPADMNKYVGGDHIYICTLRED